MTDMTVCQDPAIVANHCFHSIRSTTVDSYKFTDSTIVANLNSRSFAVKFSVLRNSCNDSTGENAAVFTDPRPFHNSNIRAYPGTIAYLNILVDNSKRINLYVSRQPGIRMNVCMWMNHAVFL